MDYAYISKLLEYKTNIIGFFKIKRRKGNIVRYQKIVFKVMKYQYDTVGC